MALFKILKGPEKKDALGNSVMLSGTNGAPPLHEGWAYVTDEGNLYVDLSNTKRVKINQNADYAIVAEYDIKSQPIIGTYIKNVSMVSTGTNAPYLEITRGDGTTFNVTNLKVTTAIKDGAGNVIADTYLKKYRTANNMAPSAAGLNGTMPPTILEYKNGYPIHTDPEFASGLNDIQLYDNAGSGKTTITRIDMACGNSSGKVLEIKNTGAGPSPNLGGWYFADGTVNARQYTCIFRAKVPTGYTINSHSNGMGTGNSNYWLTDNKGTDKWEWYAYQVNCGNGSNSSTNFFSLAGAAGSANAPVIWYLSYANTIINSYGNYDGLRTRYADVATNDISGQAITSTYLKNLSLSNSASAPSYTVTRGNGTVFSVDIPVASATNAGSITTGTQTITGAKTINANGSLTIAKSGGFIYSGIETAGDTTDGDRQVWVAHGSTKGIPVLSGANFTYNSKTKTLKVSHIIGEITKAISDTLNQQIDKTYIKNITLTGHATQPYLVLTKGDNTTSNLNLPIASTTAAGLITNAAQTIAGDKTFTGQILKKGVSSSWIGGRTNALVRMTEIHGYSPFASIKTTNGSWEIGAYDQSSYTDDLVFSYCTDANFNAGSNSTSAQIKFLENGHIVAALDGRATQALQDSQGQQINTTYLKNIALVNHATLPKYTITKGDGNTFDVNLPVANESNAGVITNTTQALAGNKSLKGSLSTTENITTAKQLKSTIANGTAPLVVTSKTVVTNLNADTVDGMHASNNSFTQANASDTTLPTQLAIWNSLNSLLISAQALVYRGTLTPAQFKALSASGINRGDVFVVSAEGNFGGKYCEPGDILICYDKTSTAVTWDIVQTNIDGSVVIKGGGAAATVHADVHAIARFDSNTGRVIDNSKVFIDDNGHMTAKATETQDIGSSDNKWRTIYAKSFNGLATNATADSSGQNIMDTYIKDWTLTKHATQPFVTLTKGNGNTSDINLPIAGQNDAGLITNAAQTIYGIKTFNTSIIAKSDHDFTSHGNEFNVIPKLSANITFNFNYRQKDGNGAGKITQYNFCNGAGGILASISQGQFSGNAATATKATQDSTGQQINTTYIKSVRLVSGTNLSYEFTRGDNTTFSVNVPISDLDGHYVKKTGDTMTGPLGLAGSRYNGPSGAYGMNCNNSDIVGINGLFTANNAENFAEGLNFYRSTSTWDAMAASNGTFYFGSNVGFGAGFTGSANIVAGAATFNGCVFANRKASTVASFVWNKSGTNWGGIGYNGVSNENYFGPCDTNGNWVAIGNCGAERWRFAGQIIIQSPTSDSVAYGATNPTITFMNVDKSKNVSLIYSDYDSVRAPAGIKLIGNQGNEWFQAPRVFGAVWNDYAEYRSTSKVKPGQCVIETGLGDLVQSTERLQPGANIVSDTFGFAIGETETIKTPLAVSGRVLAYPYEDRYSYSAGDPVCSGPNGTISKMTREEVREYPDRIVGTVSEIPEYEIWGTGNVKVDRRIWIKVK